MVARFFLLGAVLLAWPVLAGSVDLEWDPSPDLSVTEYRLYANGVLVSSRPSIFLRTRATDLQEGRNYVFHATAVDAAGNESAPSNEVSYSVPVHQPVLNVIRIGPGVVRLGWRDTFTSESGWEILKSSDGGETFQQFTVLPADQTHVNDFDVEPGGTYFYKIVVHVGELRSAPSRTVSAFTEK